MGWGQVLAEEGEVSDAHPSAPHSALRAHMVRGGKYCPLSWNSSTLATSCEELTHWKRLWCWEGLGAGGEGDNRGWDGWMASLTRWTWVWVNSGSWWWTERPGMLGSQRVEHDWVTELNWTLSFVCFFFLFLLLGWYRAEILCRSLEKVTTKAKSN